MSDDESGSEREAALWIGALALICALLLALVPPAVQAGLQEKRERRTMFDMRNAATAVEGFARDEHRYPRQDRLGPIRDDMARLLEGTYIRTLPLRDAWDRPFLYWSNETDYVLISLGSDGRRAAELQTYRRPEGGGFVGDDILYRSDWYRFTFTPWPEGSATE